MLRTPRKVKVIKIVPRAKRIPLGKKVEMFAKEHGVPHGVAEGAIYYLERVDPAASAKEAILEGRKLEARGVYLRSLVNEMSRKK